MELEFADAWVRCQNVEYTREEMKFAQPKHVIDVLQVIFTQFRPRKVVETAHEQLHHFHIAVDGAAGAGKTRLISTLADIESSQEYAPTHGVTLNQVIYQVLYKGETHFCCLHLWEFGAYFARKYEYIQDQVGTHQDAVIHVLSILDRSSFQELVTRGEETGKYTCIFLSKTDLSLQTNIFPSEVKELKKDVFVNARTLATHICAKMLENKGV